MKLIMVIVMAAAIVAGIALVGAALAGSPQHVYVDASTAFVVGICEPVGPGCQALYTNGRLYKVEGALASGCYELTEAADGEDYGKARLVWPTCDR